MRVESFGSRGPRKIVRNVYRGVYFYSSDGGALGPKQQASIVAAAKKIPPVVWDKLASAGTRIFMMKNKDAVMAPVALEYMNAIGVSKKDAIYSYKGEKDMAYTDKARHPVAVVGIGTLPPYPSGMPRPKNTKSEGPGHILMHETAHTVDFSFQVMKAMGAAYGNLEGKTFRSAAKAAQVAKQYRRQPMSVIEPGRMDVSALPAFRSTVPKDYTAGYGDATKTFDDTVKYPKAEVFAEALAHYWSGNPVPWKMKTFFDDYFTER